MLMEGGELGRNGSASGAVLVVTHTAATPADALVTVMMPSSSAAVALGIATAVAIQLNCMLICALLHFPMRCFVCMHLVQFVLVPT